MSEVENCHIQPDFVDCIYDVQERTSEKEKFYINVEPSVYEVEDYTVYITKDGDSIKFEVSGDGNNFNKIGDGLYMAQLSGKKYKFKVIKNDYSLQSDRNITALDIAKVQGNDAKFAIGDTTGSITLHDSSLKTKLSLDGHDAEITDLKFFPSSQVLLSSSMDMRLKIWSALDGSNPRTITGHKSIITGTEIIERGRNILSCSKDGTVKLWECGSGKNIYTFTRRENKKDSVNAMLLLSSRETEATEPENDLEFGTSGKTVLAGHDSGVIMHHDIYSKSSSFSIPNEFLSPCTTLASNSKLLFSGSPFHVYAGYENGALAQWDLRRPEKSVNHVFLNKQTPINSVYHHEGKLYVSSNVDSNAEFELDRETGNVTEPTFLVSNDYKVAQYKASSGSKEVFAVGNWGFVASYCT